MRYFKCIKSDDSWLLEDIKEGRIYEVNDDGTGLVDGDGFEWDSTSIFKENPRSFYQHVTEDIFKMEEVSRGDWIIQEFFNGNILLTLGFEKNRTQRILKEYITANGISNRQGFIGNGYYYVEGISVQFAHLDSLIPDKFKDKEVFLDDSAFEIKTVAENKEKEEEIKKEINDMKLSDIKTGMVIETREEGRAMVVNGLAIFSDGRIDLCNYHEDLTMANDEDGDYEIIAVYEVGVWVECFDNILNDEDCLELIWKKEAPVSEQEYEVGDIYIVPEHERYYDANGNKRSILIGSMDDCDAISISHGEAKELIEILSEILENAKNLK